MTTLREAAQQALEALLAAWQHNPHWQTNDAITALRKALAQPEPRNQCGETCERAKLCAVCARGLDGATQTPCDIAPQDDSELPLYTHPPRREWHPLTDKEIRRMGIETPGQQGGWNLAFARAIEQALKEKNNG
jgi:hypothetical protein